MSRHSSSLPDFLSSQLESLRHSLSSSPSSPFSASSSTPPPLLFAPSNPTLLDADLAAYTAARQQYSRGLTAHKVQRALQSLHADSLSQLLGNERQQQRAVASLVARSGVAGRVRSGLAGCEVEVGEMDVLLGELVVRLKALDGVVARLPAIVTYDLRLPSVAVEG